MNSHTQITDHQTTKTETAITQPANNENVAGQASGFAFADLNLVAPLLQAVEEAGYRRPTPIQEKAIPALLSGRDLLGLAQTGTGKTAAFVLPLLQRLMAERRPAKPKSTRALILAPTRELVVQIQDSIRTYGKHLPLRVTTIFGGVGQNPQVNTLRRGIDIVVATPGRLLDLINQGHVMLNGVETLILDEADRMLDMGFIRDIKRIVATVPKQRHTLLFSATMPRDVADLANGLLNQPVRVEVVPQATTAERIEQKVYLVPQANKRALLVDLMEDKAVARAIVFTRTKRGADRLTEQLERAGIASGAIHGNKSQNIRQKTLGLFREGKMRALVATDIAARGIDIDGITHVFNYDLPMEPEAYVHRIGRTARAGASGIAISLCAHEERSLLRDIERITRQKFAPIEDHAFRIVRQEGPAHAPVNRIAERNGSAPHPKAHGHPHGHGHGHGNGQGQGRDGHGHNGHGHNGHGGAGEGRGRNRNWGRNANANRGQRQEQRGGNAR